MLMIQAKLQSGETHRTCWLDCSKRLIIGTAITLKNSDEPDRWWKITGVGNEVKDSSLINTDWQVGGISTRMGH